MTNVNDSMWSSIEINEKYSGHMSNNIGQCIGHMTIVILTWYIGHMTNNIDWCIGHMTNNIGQCNGHMTNNIGQCIAHMTNQCISHMTTVIESIGDLSPHTCREWRLPWLARWT